jgi:Xaa-Pro aminopeptidase
MSIAQQERLGALRAELTRRGLDGFVVPLTDEHLSEYVGDYAQRLSWLTGYRGSAGVGVVLADQAALFVDGRYLLQAQQEVDARQWQVCLVRELEPEAWLAARVNCDAQIGFDPWLHTAKWQRPCADGLAVRNARLIPIEPNPVDAIWSNRPGPSTAPVVDHPVRFAGRSREEKRAEIAAWLAAQEADALILTALDSIAWAFNIRGSDIPHTPVALAYAVICADGAADLFISPGKVSGALPQKLGGDVRLHPAQAWPERLAEFSQQTVVIDPDRTVFAISQRLIEGGARIVERRDPVVLSKALKNPVEVAGQRAAHLRDGVAVTRFLHWFASQAPNGHLTELSAAKRLREFRAESAEFRDLSFETISAYGPNGAVIHHHPTPDRDRLITPGSIYLVDSGGQYPDGTTDIARAVAVGEPMAEMRDRFTRVLKGHIALATAAFPDGTRGLQLDALARRHLWAIGYHYPHGTGHGVGAYLSVHEGPQLIGSSLAAVEPLQAGMILSNEPGFYKEGAYGMRFENLMLVVRLQLPDASREMLGFEVLSCAPIDLSLVDASLLAPEERAWVDAYHARVQQSLGPHLPAETRAWLADACRPLA